LSGTRSVAVAVNALDQVIGNSSTAGDSTQHAFLWQNGTGIADLGTLGGTYSSALAVNDQGQIVGQSSTATGETHAALWNTVIR
jgi:probable HAF family extracellular repeat protein